MDNPTDIKIYISTKDDNGKKHSDGLYHGIVMGLYKIGWRNTGIVFHCKTAIKALNKCSKAATKKGWWGDKNYYEKKNKI